MSVRQYIPQAAANRLVISCDATCRVPNANIKGRSPLGKAACGIVIVNENGEVLLEHSKYLGELTVPQAEYKGLIEALDKAAGICRKQIEVWMDSEFVVKQLNGIYRIRAEPIKPLFDRVKQLEQRFEKVVYNHHTRTAPKAKRPDELANKELDRQLGVAVKPKVKK